MRVLREQLCLVNVPRLLFEKQATSFKLGDQVLLKGLVSAPQHNGKRGTLLKRVVDKSGELRWRVELQEQLLDLKDVNLADDNEGEDWAKTW